MSTLPPTPIRVLRLLPTLDYGGVESRVLLQARLVDRETFDLTVGTFWKDGECGAAIREEGIEVVTLDRDPTVRNPIATARLAAYLSQQRPDIVHASIGEANFHALMAGPLVGVPVVIAEEVGMPRRSALGRRLFPFAYRRATQVVGVSESVCEHLIEEERAPADRVRRIYNAADSRHFPTERPSPRRRRAGPIELLIVGRLEAVKNHEVLFRALARLDANPDQLRLSVIGDGPRRAALERHVSLLELEDVVRFLGFRADVPQLLRESHGVVLCSHSEGFGLAALEGMAAGTPVLASELTSLVEVLGAEGRPWTATPTHVEEWVALLRRFLALSWEDREALGERLQTRAYEVFSPERYVGEVERMYRELIAQVRS